MEVKAPLRNMEKASLDCATSELLSENDTLDEHDREGQYSENASCNPQTCETEDKTLEHTVIETRDQSPENNDNESEKARRCCRENGEHHKSSIRRQAHTEDHYTSEPDNVVEFDHF